MRFAAEMEERGFRPDFSMYAQNETGGFTGISVVDGKLWLTFGPGPSELEKDFYIEPLNLDECRIRIKEIYRAPVGMGGVLGFGTKGYKGYDILIARTGRDVFKISLYAGYTSCLETPYNKNSLLKTKRRRGNANFVWDFKPLGKDTLEKMSEKWLPILNVSEEDVEHFHTDEQ